MSRECPITTLTCRNPACQGNKCSLERPPFEQKSHELGLGKPNWEDIEKAIRQTPSHLIHDFGHTVKQLVSIVDMLVRREDDCKKHQRVEQVLYFIFNNNKYIITMLSIASNQSAPIVLGLIDSDTKQPVTATFSGETETSDNPAVATTDPVLGLIAVKSNTAGGTGNLTSVATWVYTDKNTGGQVTVQLTTVTPFTVTPVISAEKVEMVVTLGTPVTQP